MKNSRGILLAVSMAVFIALPTQAATYYAAPNGNDNDAGTEAEPWASLDKIGSSLRAGDICYLKAGTYSGFLTMENSGNANDGYITVQNFENDEVIIDCERRGGSCVSNNQGESYLKFIGLNVRNHSGNGIRIDGPASHFEIRDCSVMNGSTNTGAVFRGQTHAFLIFAGLEWGAGTVSNVIIEGNEVGDNSTGGNESLTLWGDVTDFEVLNNVVHDGSNICMDMIGCEGPNQWGGGDGNAHPGIGKGKHML
ncbi:hypothetical protein ACFL5V_05180 [Fibrobacterota bacterium]